MNLLLAGFNLLPAFPMDGGRIFRALLARRRPYGTATRIAARVGVVFAFLFAIVGVLSFNLIMLLAFFIYGAATTESRTVLLDEPLAGLTVGDIMTRTPPPPTVDADTTVAAVGDQLLHDRQPLHLVTDGAGTPLGIVTLADLQGVAGQDHATTRVGDVLREAVRVEPTDDAFDAPAVLNQAGSQDAVVASNGDVVGVLSQSDYAHAMTIRRGFRGAVAT